MTVEKGGVASIAEAVAAGRTKAADMVRESLTRLGGVDTGPNGLNAFITYDPAGSASRAAEIDADVAAGKRSGPLAGVPIALKDNICTLDYPTTCGSRILEGYRSPFEATIVRRLRDAGAVIIGKTNLDEFAMGSTTENSAFGPTRNPHDSERTAGGSSGGSAAAVAAGIVPAAVGTDTGGSVRQPAAYCGVVGLKPSYGRISRYGVVTFASSLDTVGIFGRSVADAALLLEVLSGPDRFDATAADLPAPDLDNAVEGDLKGLVIGVPREFFPEQLDPGIAAACSAAIERMRDAGAEIREVSLPHSRYAIPTYYTIAPAEASSNLARFDGIHYGMRSPEADSTSSVYDKSRSIGLGTEVKRRILLGTYVLQAGSYEKYFVRAHRARELIRRDIEKLFESGVDVLFTPATLGLPPKLGRVENLYRHYLGDILTVTANLAAMPAISVPIGTADGLPVGGQFIAARWDEATLIRAAAGLERVVSE